MVGVAQLVELRIVIPVVAGSTPVAHPIFYVVFIVTCAMQLGFFLKKPQGDIRLV